MAPQTGELLRRRLTVRGRVQGVGFRPFVYRLARELSLGGTVRNDMQGAAIELEGPASLLDEFTRRLHAELPPLARITSIESEYLPPTGDCEFTIDLSDAAGVQEAHISPDAATCDDCLRELAAPADRRHGYPFINCTNCGPRYSIIRGVPYDRPNTTMAAFTMCPACQAEYDDPADRRFHAQPNACAVCGPRVSLVDSAGAPIEGDPLDRTRALLAEGAIVAVKGLGGFHLACRADRDAAVARLRENKSRRTKPLAIMVPSLDAAREFVTLTDAAVQLLTSPARPIVLAPARPDAPVSPHVAPGVDSLGVMLPYTPLHHLLFADGLSALVMTSGNPASEPLCCDNAEAFERLASLTDAFLLHNRDIERRVEDSVISAMGAAPMPLRRARGYAPEPIQIPMAAPEPILAVGGELKSTICLLAGDEAVLSEHLGDLDNPDAFREFQSTVTAFKQFFARDPAIVACDMHGDYASTRYASKPTRRERAARSRSRSIVAVQHHHAHIVSCMADNGITGEVIGLACDGTGYGRDGHVWGCELLRCDEAEMTRAGHLRYVPHVGGDAVSRETWRPAAAFLWDAFEDGMTVAREMLLDVDPVAMDIMTKRFARQDRPLYTSSLGRLFDAAAAILGICDANTHEARAPMMLESLARSAGEAKAMDYRLGESDNGRLLTLDPRPMIRQLVEGKRSGQPVAMLAWAFHRTVAQMLSAGAVRVASETGLTRVVLSGGCFANALLTMDVTTLLRQAGLDVFVHRRVPTTDGGLALGQAVIAAARQVKG